MSKEPGKELLWKFAVGNCSSSEQAFVERWIKLNEDNRKKYERIQLYLQALQNQSNSNLNPGPIDDHKDLTSNISNYIFAIVLMIFVFLLFGLFYILKN